MDDPIAGRIATLERISLIGLTAFYFLFGLGAYGLLNDNEGLYAEIAREMASGGSLLAPHLNGVPYLEKPPLLVWLGAGLYALFGHSALALRALPAAAGMALVAASVAFTARVKDELSAWVAGLVLASSLALVVVLRTFMPDGLLTCLFSLAMYLFYLWHARQRPLLLVLCYALLGLAVLAKGFLALALAALTFVAFGAVCRRSWRWLDLLEPRALAALVAVAAPWHLLLAWHNFDFAWFYVYNEHVLRFLGLRRPQDYYTGPIYYYLPRILIALVPWSAFLPLLATKRSAAASPAAAAGADADRFLWAWFWVVLAFFSVSRAKGNYYMLIGAPPLAILLAGRIAERVRECRWRGLLALTGVIIAAGAAVAWIVASNAWTHHPHGLWIAALKLREGLVWSTAAFAAIATLAGALMALRRLRGALLALAVSGIPLLLFFTIMMQRAEPYASERALARYLRVSHPGEPVLLYQDFERLSSLPYYLRRTLPIVDTRSDDLLFGERYAPAGAFLTDAQFAQRCGRERLALLVHRERMQAFEASLGRLGLRPETEIGGVTVFGNCAATR